MFLLLQYSTPHGLTFLSKNLPGLFPSFDTTLRVLRSENELEFGFTKEGFEVLSQCLHNSRAQRFITVSEDCTACLQLLEWREDNNSIYGICPKDDKELKSNSWKLVFRDESVIRLLEWQRASGELHLTTQVMVYVATPLERTAPSVIVAVFPAAKGSLKNGVIRERWKMLHEMAQKENITILSHASDAVPSSLLAMKKSLKDSSLEREIRRFRRTNVRLNFGFQNNGSICVYFQDMLHQATKARSLLRNSNYILKIGAKHVQIEHLEMLLAVPGMVEQSIGLRKADLILEDK